MDRIMTRWGKGFVSTSAVRQCRSLTARTHEQTRCQHRQNTTCTPWINVQNTHHTPELELRSSADKQNLGLIRITVRISVWILDSRNLDLFFQICVSQPESLSNHWSNYTNSSSRSQSLICIHSTALDFCLYLECWPRSWSSYFSIVHLDLCLIILNLGLDTDFITQNLGLDWSDLLIVLIFRSLVSLL